MLGETPLFFSERLKLRLIYFHLFHDASFIIDCLEYKLPAEWLARISKVSYNRRSQRRKLNEPTFLQSSDFHVTARKECSIIEKESNLLDSKMFDK